MFPARRWRLPCQSKSLACLLLLSLGPVALGQPASSPRSPTLYLIGDSTVNSHTRGQLGWGDPLVGFFDRAKIKVENRARGGRSSRTFYTEGLWDKVLAELQPGDFVLIQFGHNDGGSLTGPRGRASLKGNGEQTQTVSAETTGKKEVVHTYGWYIRQYVAGARKKGATPIVLSPVPRNLWRGEKTVARAANDYARWAAEAARQEKGLFIDLNDRVAARYEADGQDKVKTQYFGQDHTHTTAAGAQVTAIVLCEALRQLQGCTLSQYLLVRPDKGSPSK